MTRWGRFRGGIAANDLSRRASHRTICVDDALHFGGSRCLSAGTGGRAQKVLQDPLSAPVAQWIEQRFPKPRAQVRFLSGALQFSPEIRRKGHRAGRGTAEGGNEGGNTRR